MKYVISSSEFTPEIIMGHDTSHQELRKAMTGKVGSAGFFDIEGDLVIVGGYSIGLGIGPSKRDAALIASALGLGYDKVHPKSL